MSRNRPGAIWSSRSCHSLAAGVTACSSPCWPRTTTAGRRPGVQPRKASERTATLVAAAMAGATAARNSVSRSVKSRPARTMPAPPQHAPSVRNMTRHSWSRPNGRQTLLNLALRRRWPSGMSESLATASLRLAKAAKVCGSSGEYSDSASRGSYSGAYLRLAVGHGADHQRFRVDGGPAGHLGPDLISRSHRMACGVELAHAEAGRCQGRDISRARWARSSHIPSVSHRRASAGIPTILGSTPLHRRT